MCADAVRKCDLLGDRHDIAYGFAFPHRQHDVLTVDDTFSDHLTIWLSHTQRVTIVISDAQRDILGVAYALGDDWPVCVLVSDALPQSHTIQHSRAVRHQQHVTLHRQIADEECIDDPVAGERAQPPFTLASHWYHLYLHESYTDSLRLCLLPAAAVHNCIPHGNALKVSVAVTLSGGWATSSGQSLRARTRTTFKGCLCAMVIADSQCFGHRHRDAVDNTVAGGYR